MRIAIPGLMLPVASWMFAACTLDNANAPHTDALVIAAYSAPREAFEKSVFPAFRADWRKQTGRDIRIRASYLGSGAQARAVTDGFPADVVVLALEPDVDKIAKAGLIASDWRRRGGVDGIVARTTVALAVRTGNPKGLREFKALGRPGIEVVAPNPMTSGAAIWTFLALVGTRPVEGARDEIRAMARNVVVMDKGARESIINFERGIGDVAVTYEQETVVARRAGRRYDVVIPEATLIVEIPAAVVDRNVDARGTRKAAEAFVRFLSAPEGERAMGEWGFHSARGDVPGLRTPFRVRDVGGWEKVRALFGKDGAVTNAIRGTE